MIAWARQWARACGVLFERDLLALVLAAAAGWHDPRPVATLTLSARLQRGLSDLVDNLRQALAFLDEARNAAIVVAGGS